MAFWLVLFTDRFSYAITGSHPHFILSTPKNSKSLHTNFLWLSFRITILRYTPTNRRPKTANRYIRISFEYLLELQYSLMDFLVWYRRCVYSNAQLSQLFTKTKNPSWSIVILEDIQRKFVCNDLLFLGGGLWASTE